MYLSQRLTRYEDFEACYRLIHNGFVFEKTGSKEDLRAFWRQIFSESLPVSVVIEDRDRPVGKRIVAHGCTVFITDDFARQIAGDLPAYPGYQLVRHWKAGRRFFLNAREIAQANTQGGLNSFTLHHGWENGPGPEEEKRHLKLIDAFFEFHKGWRLKSQLLEVYGLQEKKRAESTGCLLLRDYREKPPNPKPPAGRQPFLTGLFAEGKSQWKENYAAAQIFNYTPPRFQFSPREKEVLLLSLENLSDMEISKSLHLSLWAVKKRWQAVYARAGRRDASLVRPEPSGASRNGTDPWIRRRRLLEYLRYHLEELRPTAPPSRRGLKKIPPHHFSS